MSPDALQDLFVVTGRVSRETVAKGAATAAGVTVRAFDQDVASATLLGEAVTNADGVYRITFTEAQYLDGDVGYAALGGVAVPPIVVAQPTLIKSGPDLWVGVPGDGDSWLIKSDIVFNAGQETTIDLTLPPPAVHRDSEFEELVRLVLPRIKGIKPQDLTAAQIDFLSKDAQTPREQIVALASAARLAEDARALAARNGSDLGDLAFPLAAAAYAFERSRPGLNLAGLLALDEAVWRAQIPQAVDRRIIPVSVNASLDALVTLFVELRAWSHLEPTADSARAGLGDLLNTIPAAQAITDRTARVAIATAWAETPDLGDAFWKRIEGLGLAAPQVAALKTTFALDSLCGGNRRLISVLQAKTSAEPDGTLGHLAALAPNDWISAAAEAAAPTDSLAAIEQRATGLAEAVARLHPSRTLFNGLANGTLQITDYPAAKVTAFLGEHSAFDVMSADVEPELIAAGFEKDDELKQALLDMQRPLRLGASQAEASMLLNAGSSSAHAIVARGKDAFVTSLDDVIPAYRLDTIYDNAQLVAGSAIGLAIDMTSFLSPGSIVVLPRGGQSSTALARFPSLARLFGDLSSCACPHCRSVLSPAAYLVDLLQLLTEQQVEPALRARRPDIAELELSCDNTNIELPYVDLVLEVLENAITFPKVIPLSPAERAEIERNAAPANVVSALAETVSSMDGSLQVEGAPPPKGAVTAQPVRFTNGPRRWSALLDRGSLVASGGSFTNRATSTIAIPEGDQAAVLADLTAGRVSKHLLTDLAPEPLLPVVGGTVPRGKREQEWRLTLERQVAVVLTPGTPAGVLQLQKIDGTAIQAFPLQPGSLVQRFATDLNAGRVPAYVANLLPALKYDVRWDAVRSRWLLSATQTFTVRYTPDRLTITGLVFTASASADDLTVFPENRNPAAYQVLDQAVFPWILPFDVFVEDVRTCLQTLGFTRGALLRALRPAVARATMVDAAETFRSNVAQLGDAIETNTSPARSAAFWGLQPTGNVLTDPSGDTQAPPIPTDWVGALGRLSILLDRSELASSSLMAALSTQYVAGGASPQLTPTGECRPSRITVAVSKATLDRLQQFLRLRLITGWSIRDLDALCAAVSATSGQAVSTPEQTVALANAQELAQRLSVGLRQVGAWLGPFETWPYTDLEADGSPTLPSLYADTFLSSRFRRTPDPDFVLDATGRELAYVTAQTTTPPTYKKLSDKLPELGRALHLTASDLLKLIAVAGAPAAPVPDSLELANLLALFRYATFADALALTIPELLLLEGLTGSALFVDGIADPPHVRGRRLLDLADVVTDVRAWGLAIDDIGRLCGAAPLDEQAAAARLIDQLNWLTALQPALRVIVPLSETGATDEGIRAAFATAGWPASAVDRLMRGSASTLGLASAIQVSVTVQAAAAPVVPATLPFDVTPVAGTGEYAIGVVPAMMADTGDPDAAFNALATVAGLGPITDAGSPAARLRDEWRGLLARINALARWLQSIELPRFATPLVFDAPAPQGLTNTTVPPEFRTRIESTTTGLRVTGFLSDGEAKRLKQWFAAATNATALAGAFDGMVGPPAQLTNPDGPYQFDAVTKTLVLVGYLTASDVVAIVGANARPEVASAAQALVTMAANFVEERAGQRLINAADVLSLVLHATSLQERFAALSVALVQPLRRLTAGRLLAARTGIDPRLFAALDRDAQLAVPPRDLLAPLCADSFVMSTLDADSPPAAAIESVESADRTGLLAQRLKVRAEQQAWFDPAGGFQGVPGVGFLALAGTAAAPASRLLALRRALTLVAIRDTIPGQAATIERLRTLVAAGSLDDASDVIARAFRLPAETDTRTALHLDGLVTAAADLGDPLLLGRVVDAARALRKLATPPATAVSFCNGTLTEAEAQGARGMLIAKFGDADGQDALRRAMNALRERQRAALVAFLIQRDNAIDSADLHARYLLDVEMGADVRTSRIKQAISSTQLFLQRWLMHLEDPELPEPDADVRREWEWTKNYRVWEANRKVFLTPENWLDPSLRDDKSHIFRRLESTLLQGQVTSERSIEALATYLADLEEISRVTVLAMYRETAPGPRQGTIHLIGRTPNQPARYFYRQWTVAGALGSWQPWQPVEVVGDTDHIVVFVRNGRPQLAWLQIEKAQPDAGSDAATATPAWAVSLVWSQLGESGWTAPKKSRNKISHIKEINKDAASTFVMRLQSPGSNAPTVCCYAGYTDDLTRGGDPIPYPQTPDITSTDAQTTLSVNMIDAQVLGTLHDTGGGADRRVPLADARIEAWAEGSMLLGAAQEVYQWGSSASPWNITTSGGGGGGTFVVSGEDVLIMNLVVHVRASFPGAPAQEKTTDALNLFKNNTIKVGFTFDVNGNTSSPSLNALIAGTRKLRMLQFASGTWGLGHSLAWTAHEQLPTDPELPVADADGNSLHYNSGFLFQPGVPVKWGQTTIVPAASENIFLAATTDEGATGIGYPLYIEAQSSAASGFVFVDESNALSFLPATEITHVVAQQAVDADQDTLDLPSAPPDALSAASLSSLGLTSAIAAPYDRAMAQFERALPYANYDWEVFFHIPLMAASALATHQRFGEALRWLHLVFDPTHGRDSGGASTSVNGPYWRFPPFAAAGQGRGIDALLAAFSAGTLDSTTRQMLQQQIDFSRRHPFNPHGLARVRTRAYQWMTVLAYLDVLIAWGDQLFRRDTIESINEATQLYLLAFELLGRRPSALPETPATSITTSFAALQGQWDASSNAWVAFSDLPFFKALQALLASKRADGGRLPVSTSPDWPQVHRLARAGALVFCVPPNEKLAEYWDTIDDRLFKIRHSQNIEGVERTLALFEPPIDPALLVRAVAAGLDLGSVLNDLFAPLPHYRFNVVLQKATDFCSEVRALGNLLLSALEKQDSETLARLRSTHEMAVLDLVSDVKRRQVDEADANLRALRQNRRSVEVRYRHYQRLMGKDQIQVPAEQAPAVLDAPRLRIAGSTSDKVDADLRGFGLSIEETDQLQQLSDGNELTLRSSVFQIAAAIGHAGPNFSWPLGPSGASMSAGGSNIGHAIGATGQVFSMLAGQAAFQANRSAIVGGHQRRYDDWVLQSNLAAKELEQIDKQILASEIRVDIARKDLTSHLKQVEDAHAVDDFLASKFSRQELYQWMVDRLTDAHSLAYDTAYDLAKRAERAYAFELGVDRPGIVTFGAWDTLRSGLLAGERLAVDLKRLEQAYLDRNARELEITRHVSLNELDPIALLALQTDGACEFVVPEALFDVDFPGHYFRRLKTVSVSVPCVVGPYTSVAGTLTLLENRVRTRTSGEYPYRGLDDPRFVHDVVPIQSVATSSAQNDAGVFELNFRDERYLPFEGAGAVSRWRFELPSHLRTFDYSTISDLVLHLRYTARDGGAALKGSAAEDLVKALATELKTASDGQQLVRVFSLRRDFATEWSRLTAPVSEAQSITIDMNRFPFIVRGQSIAVWKVASVVLPAAGATLADPPLVLHAPAAAYRGTTVPPPAVDLVEAATDGQASLYEFTLSGGDPDWQAVKVNGADTWRVEIASPGAGYRDILLAVWWKLD